VTRPVVLALEITGFGAGVVVGDTIQISLDIQGVLQS